ncbi:MAG TPA: ABC transporter ATP-binding protein [Aliidongia sp.]|uniref:ABC transporter ATP-binding protein n=1 Tax=Aliidongia sp. TaxID=1914230 RepID=UPI002DDCBF0C|nr:ABC transporter ATP-binding protein [Aliidongia sp.]HEV2677714.1 ABC transporter ATP-binding protein [Aliidongia sp.]
MTDHPATIERISGPRPVEAAASPAIEPISASQPMEKSIYGFILRYSLRDQLVVLALTALSLPFYYLSLDLPKTIVNAINGKGLREHIAGWHFDQTSYLAVLCGLFLALVIVNGGFKYWINVLKGRLGERMLRRLRFELYHRILRFPLLQFRRTSPGELIPMITSEVEPLGGFIGDAFALPAQQGGTLLTAIFFLFVQDPVLGAAAVALYPLQGYVIPKLQRKVNQLGKQRVRTIRTLADRVGESVGGIQEIHANDSARLQLADFAERLGRIYEIRFEIYQRKFFVKFLNNMINQLTPFFFYSIGGYLVIRGQLSFGSLVAVLSAYKDLAAPWKELLDFYQTKEDSRIKYEQVVEQFQPPGLIDRTLQLTEPDTIAHLTDEIAITGLSYSEDDRAHILDGIDLTLPLGPKIAIVGNGTSGKGELAMLLARLLVPTAGRIMMGGQDLNQLPYAITGRRIAYVGSTAGLFASSIRDNLLFGLKHRPVVRPQCDAATAKRRQKVLFESSRAGNLDYDIQADWVDYERAAIAEPSALTQRLLEVVGIVDLEDDVYRLGLRGRLNAKARPEAAAGFVEARKALATQLTEASMDQLVERFEIDHYNTNLSFGDNLLFGTPTDATFASTHLAENPYVQQVLDKVGLTQDLIATGLKVAETMLELFADLAPGHEFFDQFSFIAHDELPDYRAILNRVTLAGVGRLKAADRVKLIALPFRLVETRHRLGLIDEALRLRVVEARAVFRADLPDPLRSKIEFFDPDRYNGSATILENVLFGSVAFDAAQGTARVQVLVTQVLDRMGLCPIVSEVGLDYQVGSAGSRLTATQRQKAAIARAMIKRPDLLILNEAVAVLDPAAQQQILAALQEQCKDVAMIVVLQRARFARHFDHVVVMEAGRVVEHGSFVELDRPESSLTQLIEAET